MREAFCLLGESKRRRYYCSTKGRILSVSKQDRSHYRFLKEISGRRHSVYVNGRRMPIPIAIALSFFKATAESYRYTVIRFSFRDGNPDNLGIDNMCFFFEEVTPRKEARKWSESTITSRSTDG